MAENLLLALQITLVGMGLVFGAIVVVIGLMALLVRVTGPRPERAAARAGRLAAPESAAAEEIDRKRQAAAVAVAVALKQSGGFAPHPMPVARKGQVSPWQAAMRGRSLGQKGPVR
jgi:Na+-transporting methylmalonyl-CoA/oxaloacetate decarboxylase gamma subunit